MFDKKDEINEILKLLRKMSTEQQGGVMLLLEGVKLMQKEKR